MIYVVKLICKQTHRKWFVRAISIEINAHELKLFITPPTTKLKREDWMTGPHGSALKLRCKDYSVIEIKAYPHHP